MTKHPREFQDTDPAAMEVWLELLRKKPAGEKLAATLGASDLLLAFFEMGVRRLHPNAGENEIRARVAARHLPRDLVLAVYGWDPADGQCI
jgi:hypothetical protein